jgi:hypothetical protein
MGMFNDVLGTNKGSGIMGGAIALITFAAFGGLYFLVFDERMQGGEISLESIIKNQQTEIEDKKLSIEHFDQNQQNIIKNFEISHQADKTKLNLESIVTDHKLIREKKDLLLKEMALMNDNYEKYKSDYRLAERSAAIGEKIPQIISKTGKSYNNLIIKKIDDLRFQFSHEGGSGKIKWNELPDNFIDRFQMTKELADQLTRKESMNENENFIRANISELNMQLNELETAKTQSVKKAQLDEKGNQREERNLRILQQKLQKLYALKNAETNKKGIRRIEQYQNEIDNLNQEIARVKNNIGAEENNEPTLNNLEFREKIQAVKTQIKINQIQLHDLLESRKPKSPEKLAPIE